MAGEGECQWQGKMEGNVNAGKVNVNGREDGGRRKSMAGEDGRRGMMEGWQMSMAIMLT